MAKAEESLPVTIGARIYTVRGQAVMLDSDLAEVYGVETVTINQAVWRNGRRFPSDFVFRLEPDEWKQLAGDLHPDDNRRQPPRVFTSHGAIALAFVLRSAEAVAASIRIVEAVVGYVHGQGDSVFIPAILNAFSAPPEDADNLSMAVFHALPELVARDSHARRSPSTPNSRIRTRHHA